MRADRLPPDPPLARVGGAPLERQATDAGGDGCPHDALGIEAVEDHPEATVLASDQSLLLELDIVEEQRPLLVGATYGHRNLLARESGSVDVDDCQRGQSERAVGEPRASDHQHGLGVLDARDEGLLAVEHEVAVVAPQ